ncbi:hypothetical protein [Actinoplanes sp. L3-i22]|uniref:hypothetical protein n=1 Tax=Actinoplanes sp. L3-i22 TaxID=2836373 RepID=UPI001C788557|nr:hypothetical protein [Actinoplanes sp. L3-i22]BCY13194.1 hypothetical protein L3i22_082820 [Actinoplanes sp. L3-i22]
MTDPEQKRMQPGHWLLISIVALLVVGAAAVTVFRRDQDPDRRAGGVTTAPSMSRAVTPVCVPKVAETGQSVQEGLVSFGIVVTSDCPLAAVGSTLDVVAIGRDGAELTGDQASASIPLPAVLPGQRVGLGGELLVDFAAQVKSIRVRVLDTQNVSVSVFSSWPTVQVTGIRHHGPDSSGYTQVTGTLVTDPNTAKLCNPRYFLLLRDRSGALIYGVETTKSGPSFDERLPSGVDWSKGEIFVGMGVPKLGPVNTQQLTCQG